MIIRNRTEWILFNISRFISFFAVIALVITANLLLFLRGIELTEEMIQANAKLTLLNMVLLALVFCCIDEVRRRRTVDRSLEHIMEALDKITKGDFSIRLDVDNSALNRTGFREISQGINALAQELSGVETLRSDFVASVSHELKTPLAVVSNYAALLRDPGLPEEKRLEYLQAISQTTKRLADLVSNILKLNKLENQQIYPEVRAFDLAQQLVECILEYETAWEEKALELECDIREGVLVEADPELLRLVWNNLLSNAVKFTPAGGKVSVTMKLEGDWASVSVADTGCGMTKQTGARIFEKFYQADTAHATMGNGLGLALVKRVVDITGGVISVTSIPGKGSTFTVRLGRAKDGTV